MGHDLKFKMAAMPIYGKNNSDDFFLKPPGGFGLYFAGSIWGTWLYIIVKIIPVGLYISLDCVGEKLGKMTQNFRYMNLLS